MARIIAKAIIDGRQGQSEMKLPNLSQVAPTIDKFKHLAEQRAASFVANMQKSMDSLDGAFAEADKVRAEGEQFAADINKIAEDIKQATNGGPTLGDSSPAPGQQAASPSDPSQHVNGAGGAPQASPLSAAKA